MEYDDDKIDETVLAVLLLTLHQDYYVWKNIDWDVMDRLHEKGYIDNPKSKAKSVSLSDDGLEKARNIFDKLFGKEK
ncbi:MAG: DUF6429 family protein [Sulfuricurvum sp.]|nr:DUF6429 family protein [Sulfuricurvum sp.]